MAAKKTTKADKDTCEQLYREMLFYRRFEERVNVAYTKGRDYDVERFHGDPSRLQELLGHECHVDIRTGLERSAALFRNHFAAEEGDVE